MRHPGPAEFVECYCSNDCFLSGEYDAMCPYHSCGGMEAEAEIDRLRKENAELKADVATWEAEEYNRQISDS